MRISIRAQAQQAEQVRLPSAHAPHQEPAPTNARSSARQPATHHANRRFERQLLMNIRPRRTTRLGRIQFGRPFRGAGRRPIIAAGALKGGAPAQSFSSLRRPTGRLGMSPPRLATEGLCQPKPAGFKNNAARRCPSEAPVRRRRRRNTSVSLFPQQQQRRRRRR